MLSVLPITPKSHTFFYGLQGPTCSGTHLHLCFCPSHALPAPSGNTGIPPIPRTCPPPSICSHCPLREGLFPQVVVSIRSLLKSHLYSKTFPDHPAQVASKTFLHNTTPEPSFYLFYMGELCFPCLNGKSTMAWTDRWHTYHPSIPGTSKEPSTQCELSNCDLSVNALGNRLKVRLRATNEFLLLKPKASLSLNLAL